MITVNCTGTPVAVSAGNKMTKLTSVKLVAVLGLASAIACLGLALLTEDSASAADHNEPASVNFASLVASYDGDVDKALRDPDRSADIYDLFAWPRDTNGDEIGDEIAIIMTWPPVHGPDAYDKDTVYKIHWEVAPKVKPLLPTAAKLLVLPFTTESVMDAIHGFFEELVASAHGTISIQFGQNAEGLWGYRATGLPGGYTLYGPTGTTQTAGEGYSRKLSVHVGLFDDPFVFDFNGFFASLIPQPRIDRLEDSEELAVSDGTAETTKQRFTELAIFSAQTTGLAEDDAQLFTQDEISGDDVDNFNFFKERFNANNDALAGTNVQAVSVSIPINMSGGGPFVKVDPKTHTFNVWATTHRPSN